MSASATPTTCSLNGVATPEAELEFEPKRVDEESDHPVHVGNHDAGVRETC